VGEDVTIHPTAIVDPAARIAPDVVIGAYSVIGPHVRIGAGCTIHHHVTIEGHTTLGEECEVFPQAVLGTPPQDIKYRGEETHLELGRNNIIREMATLHPGTGNGGGLTRLGDNNLLLIGVHVAHDCRIGSHCIFANYVQFAGHVHVEDHVNMGGHTAVHHFVTIGRHAFIGGMTRVSADVPPFMICVAARGSRSEIRMVNGVGLQRSGYSHEDIASLKDAFMRLYSRRARMNGSPIRDRVEEILATSPLNPHVEHLCRFLLRSFAHGRHGRYLESLRRDPVHRGQWKPVRQPEVTVNVIGNGVVNRVQRDAAATFPEIDLVAEPKPGWRFSGWDGDLNGSANPLRVILDRDKTVTATFIGLT
jgi:UDP-N-acetylglucosamine acyltransferase